MDAQEIQELATSVQQWKIQEYTYLIGITAIFYYYLTTLDVEVSRIWSQPRWKLGKILYFALEIPVTFPIGAQINVKTCLTLFKLYYVPQMLSWMFAEGILWMCLYALLGGKAPHFWGLLITFFAFFIPTHVLQYLADASSQAVPLDELDLSLRYTCAFQIDTTTPYYSAARFISLARVSFALVLGVTVLLIRYRRQNHSLIHTIRREGGMYYLASFILSFFTALARTPGLNTPLKEPYGILYSLNNTVAFIFADRLLHHIQGSPSLHEESTAMSTLVFDPSDKLEDDGDVPFQELDKDLDEGQGQEMKVLRYQCEEGWLEASPTTSTLRGDVEEGHSSRGRVLEGEKTRKDG